MTPSELFVIVRGRLDDLVEPFLWQDADLVSCLNSAISDMCIAYPILIDSSTPEICEIQLLAGQNLYPIDSRIIRIRSAKLGSNILNIRAFDSMEAANPNWEQVGTPSILVEDYTQGHVLLVPTPNENALLKLRVSRLPLVEVTQSNIYTELEIPSRYQYYLVDGTTYYAFARADIEIPNMPRAQQAYSLWQRRLEELRRQALFSQGRAVTNIVPMGFL